MRGLPHLLFLCCQVDGWTTITHTSRSRREGQGGRDGGRGGVGRILYASCSIFNRWSLIRPQQTVRGSSTRFDRSSQAPFLNKHSDSDSTTERDPCGFRSHILCIIHYKAKSFKTTATYSNWSTPPHIIYAQHTQWLLLCYMHNRLSVAQVSKVPDPASWEREQVNMHTHAYRNSRLLP